MKKVIALLALSCILVSVFCGCINFKPDIWDGSVAESYAGGDGSQKKPYRIGNSSQLALLAKNVNDGENYSGQYFRLDRDLDLNNIVWTPIGNGEPSFNGNFDGNGHTISNLKLTGYALYESGRYSGKEREYVSGLFGRCVNPKIKNLNIDKADITVPEPGSHGQFFSGALVGLVDVDTEAEFTNIKISGAKAVCKFDMPEFRSVDMISGGLAGSIYGGKESSLKISRIQSDFIVSIDNARGVINDLGGIVGFLNARNIIEISECATELSVITNKKNGGGAKNEFGAFGCLICSGDKTYISDIFAKVKATKMDPFFPDEIKACEINAIAGSLSTLDPEKGHAHLKNLFGFVELTDTATNEKENRYELFDQDYIELFEQENCKACVTLPENHGFDSKIWDLSDLSAPKLK